MIAETKFAPGDVVYYKVFGRGVKRGIVTGADVAVWSRDFKGNDVTTKIVYTLWVSDRADNAGHHDKAEEDACASSWEEAWWGNATASQATHHELPQKAKGA